MKCPHCNVEVPDSARLCPYCGGSCVPPQPQAVPDAQKQVVPSGLPEVAGEDEPSANNAEQRYRRLVLSILLEAGNISLNDRKKLFELQNELGLPFTQAKALEDAVKEELRLKKELEQRRREEEAERKAAEKAAREKAEREAAEKAAREKAEREAAEKAAREEAERKAAEKAAREKAERKAAEKAAREKAEREAAEQAARKQEKREAEKDLAHKIAYYANEALTLLWLPGFFYVWKLQEYAREIPGSSIMWYWIIAAWFIAVVWLRFLWDGENFLTIPFHLLGIILTGMVFVCSVRYPSCATTVFVTAASAAAFLGVVLLLWDAAHWSSLLLYWLDGLFSLLWLLGFFYVWQWQGPTGIERMPDPASSVMWYWIIAAFFIAVTWTTTLFVTRGWGDEDWKDHPFAHLAAAIPFNLIGIALTCLIFVFSVNFTVFSWWVISAIVLAVIAVVLLSIVGLVFWSEYSEDAGPTALACIVTCGCGALFFLLCWLLCYPFTVSGKENLARSAENFPEYREYYLQRAAESRQR